MVIKLTSPKLLFRASLFVFVSLFMLIDRALFMEICYFSLGPFRLYELFVFILIAEMAIVLFPGSNKRVSCGKLFSRHYRNAENYSHKALVGINRELRKQVLIILIIWVLLLSNLGILYYFQVIKRSGLFLISLLFYFLDQLFISTWCPFQALFLNNKCCNTCRIYNWGHFMMFSPLVFIPNIYTQILFWLSLVLLLQWEYQYFRHPERFQEISNLNLRCTNCDSPCTRKKGENKIQV